MHFIGFVVLVSPFKCIFRLKYMHTTPNSNRLTLWISEQGVRLLASLRCENGHVGCQNWSESRIGWFSSCLLGPLRLAGKARDCAIGVDLGVFELPKSSRSNLFLTFPGVLSVLFYCEKLYTFKVNCHFICMGSTVLSGMGNKKKKLKMEIYVSNGHRISDHSLSSSWRLTPKGHTGS